MNIVVIMLDSLRADYLGCGGHSVVRTPHIDRLAREGIFFRNAYAEYPVTIPSRTALVSGIFTFTNRPWGPLNSRDSHIAEVLRDAGYVNAAFSDSPFNKDGLGMERGFQEFIYFPVGKCKPAVEENMNYDIPEAYYPDFASSDERDFFPNTIKNRQYALKKYGKACPELLFDAAIEWLDFHHQEKFFLWIDSFESHEPWCPPPPYNTMYQSVPPQRYIPHPVGPSSSWMTKANLEHVQANYMGDVTHTDEQVGKVIAKLEERGILDQTLVVVLSDHGEPLGDHGTIRKYGVPAYEELARMVLIMRKPGLIPPGTVSEALVENVDFAPTIVDLLGVSPPVEYDGQSLRPIFKDPTSEIHEAVFVGAFGMRASIRKGSWKLIDNRGQKPNELFNLVDDPGEKNNLIAKESKRAAKLHRQLWEFGARCAIPLAWRDKPAVKEKFAERLATL